VAAQSIPFAAGYFDAVVANGVFDHIPDRRQAFAESYRVLRDGGRLYAATGGKTHLQEIEALVQLFVPNADCGGASERFGLENGAALLSPWFTDIKRYRYENTLVFEEVDPILAYVLSEAHVRSAPEGATQVDFARLVQQELALRAKICVTTDKGLLEAHKRK
jgi:SAM-dependent methyltransferase